VKLSETIYPWRHYCRTLGLTLLCLQAVEAQQANVGNPAVSSANASASAAHAANEGAAAQAAVAQNGTATPDTSNIATPGTAQANVNASQSAFAATAAKNTAAANGPSTTTVANVTAGVSTNGNATLGSATPAPVTATGGLTLEQCIAIALYTHGNPQAAEETFAGAQQLVIAARSNYYPVVTGTAQYNYVKTGSSGIQSTTGLSNGTTVSTYNQSGTTTQINVAEDLFDSGMTHAQVLEAKGTAANALGAYGLARNTQAYTVATDFYAQLLQEQLIQQDQEQVDVANQQLTEIQAQIKAGTSAPADALPIQVNLSQAKFNLSTAVENLATAQINLRDQLGLGHGPALVLQPSPDDLTPTSATAPGLDPVDVYYAQARRLRPDLLQDEANINVSQAALKLAQIADRPQIDATASYNIDPRNTDDHTFDVGAGVTVPIFDGGGLKAEVRSARADLMANQIRLTQLEKDVDADVEATYVSIGNARDAVTNAQTLVENAQTSLDTASARYKVGAGIALDVSTAQSSLFEAQTSLTQAIFNYQLAKANLLRAVGRYAWANPDQAPPLNPPTAIPVSLTSSPANLPVVH